MLRKKNQNPSKNPQSQPIPERTAAQRAVIGQACSFTAIRDFMTFGDNAVMRKVQIKKEADRKTDEKMKQEKKGMDWKIVIIFMIIGAAFVVVFAMAMPYLGNLTEYSNRLVGCEAARSAATTELSFYKNASAAIGGGLRG